MTTASGKGQLHNTSPTFKTSNSKADSQQKKTAAISEVNLFSSRPSLLKCLLVGTIIAAVVLAPATTAMAVGAAGVTYVATTGTTTSMFGSSQIQIEKPPYYAGNIFLNKPFTSEACAGQNITSSLFFDGIGEFQLQPPEDGCFTYAVTDTENYYTIHDATLYENAVPNVGLISDNSEPNLALTTPQIRVFPFSI